MSDVNNGLGDELIATAVGEHGPAEVARHARSMPGTPSIQQEHYPPQENKEGERTPKATSVEEAAFLALGPGAAAWLVEAAATGARRIRPKMAEAVALAELHPVAEVDRALGTAAIAGRFAENDLIRILAHQSGREQTPSRRGRPPRTCFTSVACGVLALDQDPESGQQCVEADFELVVATDLRKDIGVLDEQRKGRSVS
ncbi:hypothetical protein SAMN05216215_102424 [Saccharopolyspora shandongensis]|uniref:DUF222 domain-containing protein n=1 Tax=Saccharopolyspora shandongensis TaxID=418495 RepID=A0A1H3IWV6_9PSEU|nr:hypothetical protein SAMN05216215_102424 [Saccharopolyspora shandongensis]